MPKSNMPTGWELPPIDNVVTPKIDQVTPAGAGDFCYVDISSVDNQEKRIREPKLIPVAEAPSRARQHIHAGDVLVSMTRPNLNAVALVGDEHDGAIASTGFDVLRPIEVDSRWLFAHVKSRSFVEEMSSLVQGALYPAVKSTEVRTSLLPLPPLNEQRRIADKIDALQAKSRRAREALKAVGPLLEKFRQSVLAAAFRGDLTAEWRKQHPDVEPAEKLLERIRAERRARWEEAELAKMRAKGIKPKDDKWKAKYAEPEPVDATGLPELPEGWCWGTLSELSTVTSGFAFKSMDFLDGGVPLIRIGDLNPPLVEITEKTARLPHEFIERYSKFLLLRGDILIAMSGATTGKFAVYDSDESALLNQRVGRVEVVVQDSRAFVEILVSSLEEKVRAAAYGGAQPNISPREIEGFLCPIPPLREQHQIVDAYQVVMNSAQAIAHVVGAAGTHLNAFDQSILAKAFRGELVPQDPNDEPASALLERIKAEREAANVGKGRGKVRDE